VEKLVLYNQIGLTDARWNGPRKRRCDIQDAAQSNHDTVYQGIARYFPDGMKPEYERVKVQYGWSRAATGSGRNGPRARAADGLRDPWFTIGLTSRSTMELGGDKDGANFPSWPSARHDSKCQLVLLPGLSHVPLRAPDVFTKHY
jgi:hypothetical protein